MYMSKYPSVFSVIVNDDLDDPSIEVDIPVSYRVYTKYDEDRPDRPHIVPSGVVSPCPSPVVVPTWDPVRGCVCSKVYPPELCPAQCSVMLPSFYRPSTFPVSSAPPSDVSTPPPRNPFRSLNFNSCPSPSSSATLLPMMPDLDASPPSPPPKKRAKRRAPRSTPQSKKGRFE